MIYIAARWDKYDISKTWSGTSYSVYKKLAERLSCQRIDTPEDFITDKISGLSTRTNVFLLKEIRDKYMNMKLRCKLKDTKSPLLAIAHMGKYDNPTYVYIDCVYASFPLIKQSVAQGWGINPYGNRLSDSYMQNLIKQEYMQLVAAKGIFCMGKWLKEYISKNYPDCADKTYFVGGGGKYQAS